jgi:hypothetical protein
MAATLELEPYGRCGFSLLPLVKPVMGNPKSGKAPLFSNWRKDDIPYEQLISRFNAGYNIGVRLEQGQLVIDVDPRHFEGGKDSLSELESELGISIKATAPYVNTGGGGFHYYLRTPEDVPLVDSLPAFPGVEFKAYGRQVVSAGSIHFSGNSYHWGWGSPDLATMPEVPERLLSLIRRPPPREVEGCGALSAEEVTFCLNQLDVEQFKDHNKWLQLMMSCHHASGGEARYEFVEWSTSDPAYAHQAWSIGRRWDSLHVNRSGPVVTAGTLYKAVLAVGGELPVGRAEDDFEALESDGGDLVQGDRLLIMMNGSHAVVNESGRFRVYSRAEDPVHGGMRWVSSGRKDFEDLYSHRRVQIIKPEKVELVPLAQWWLANRERRQYKGVTFHPEKETPGMLNLWTGFAIEPEKGDWSLLEELIAMTLCDDDPTMYEYVLNWAAYMVQHPASPAETALVLQGRKGTGKGTLGRALMAICGRHALQVAHREHLVNRFNLHLRDCLFLFVDEAFWAGDHKGEGQLKSMITEPWAFYEGKGLQATMGRNRLHILMAANSDWVVPAGMDGERRYAVASVSEKTPPRGAFDAIHAQLENGGLEAFLYDLQRRDIDGWNPRDNVPVTRALVDQKLHTLDEVGEWWYGLLLEGKLPGNRGDWAAGATLVYQEELRAALRETCRSLGASKRSLECKLAHALKRWAPGTLKLRTTVAEGEMIDKDGKGRARAYQIPPLETCRKVFEKELGMEIGWE